MQGCNDKAANSSSRVETLAWGSGRVMDSMREMAATNTTLNINLDLLTFVRLNMYIQIPRASLSNLVDNQNSWVKDLVKKNLVIAEILRGENDEDENIPEQHIEAYRTESGSLSAPIKVAINGVKGKKKRKTIDDILGFTRINSFNNKSRNNKPKCAVHRSAITALVLSASISSDGVINRNRIILDEAQTIWTCNKIMGLGYDGEEDKVISKFADMVAEDLDRADKVADQLALENKHRNLFNRIGRHVIRRNCSMADFMYDPLNHTLNFDEDEFHDDYQWLGEGAPLRESSARVLALPPLKTVAKARITCM
ncbi:hypothetical protein RHMOL_Rhmol13G0001100 [Rhododendron molle]|uniref:Uncharacterized protein n=1 Tax=Rhododendron molle TaxID=49168 RepID=A0ACC0L2P1_RHOML|nr:hypothetical protein RHMOL_Rhmol13G0001100 [Rhododendron molle]